MTRLFTLVALLCMATLAQAKDEGLYPDAIVPDAGFLRVLALGEGFVTVAGAPRVIKPHGLSDFQVLPSGRVQITWSAGETWVDLSPGRHLSVVLSPAGAKPIATEIANHPAKADVTLINATDLADVTLFVPQAKAEVFTGLTPGEMATRALRAPLTLDFELHAGGEVLTTLAKVELRRKSGITVLLSGRGGAYTAIAVPNRYER